MKEQIMNEVLQRMLPYIDNAQSGKLNEFRVESFTFRDVCRIFAVKNEI